MSDVNRYDAHYLTEGVMGGKALACAEMVLASDYDRDTQALKAEIERYIQEGIRIADQRDALRAQVEAMRAALEDAAKCILWLQASVPMSLRISKRASKDYNAAKRAALQAEP